MPRISSAAFHAGHMLIKSFTFAVRPDDGKICPYYPNLQATDAHIAVFLDHKTAIRDVATLRPELYFWQDIMASGANDDHTAQQITAFMGKAVEILERIPHFEEEEKPLHYVYTRTASTAGAFTVRMNLSKAALDAMETLFCYYAIEPVITPRIPSAQITKRSVAATIESCLQLGKAMRALPTLRKCEAFLRAGHASAEDIIAVLRKVGILFEFLPSFAYEPLTLDRDEVKMLV